MFQHPSHFSEAQIRNKIKTKMRAQWILEFIILFLFLKQYIFSLFIFFVCTSRVPRIVEDSGKWMALATKMYMNERKIIISCQCCFSTSGWSGGYQSDLWEEMLDTNEYLHGGQNGGLDNSLILAVLARGFFDHSGREHSITFGVEAEKPLVLDKYASAG